MPDKGSCKSQYVVR
jgi:hypothetical protein